MTATNPVVDAAGPRSRLRATSIVRHPLQRQHFREFASR